MKKILLVVDEFLPISTAGAIRLNSFVKELRKKYEVNVLGGDERYLYNNGYDFFDDVEYYTIKRPDDKKVLAPFKFLSYFIAYLLFFVFIFSFFMIFYLETLADSYMYAYLIFALIFILGLSKYKLWLIEKFS